MYEGAVLPEVEVPGIGGGVEPLRHDAGQQPVVVVLALGAADDLAVPFGREAVVAQHRARIVRVLLHVERLERLRIVEDEHRPVILLGEQRLVITAQVLAPADVGAEAAKLLDRVGVADAVEGGGDVLKRLGVALELLEVLLGAVECAGHDIAHELLLQPHVGRRVVPRHFRLHHPELGQVPPGLRLLGTECRPEAVDLPERGRGGLTIELAGLRQVRLAEVEVVGGEELPRLLPDGPGQDRGVDQGEVALVEEVADGLHHLVPYSGDRCLLPAPEPEVPVLEEEAGAVVLGRDRKID